MSEKLYCRCGCRGEVKRARYPSQQVRFLSGHNARLPRKTHRWQIEDRGYSTPCWIWQLSRKYTGYGELRRDGKTLYAHRWMYEQHVGPVPDGLTLDHLCGNRPCVNPAHLEAVTQRENNRRGRQTKLTAQDVDAIRHRATAGEQFKVIAASFGVTPTHVSYIVKGKNWAPEASPV